MKTTIIAALIGTFGVVAGASASSTGILDSASTSKIAFVDFAATGNFSFDLTVTPNVNNTLKLTFAKPLAGAFSNLTYSLYDGAALLKTYSITSTASSTTFNDSASFFSDVTLSANHAYTLTLAGNVALDAYNFAQYKVTAINGTIAAVPEPETYAMLLAGLGLMASIARRRRQPS